MLLLICVMVLTGDGCDDLVGVLLCLVFQGMEQRWGVKPNLYHYTSLVTCLLKAGQWSEAIAMTDRMEVR